jgi:hypothetical protein
VKPHPDHPSLYDLAPGAYPGADALSRAADPDTSAEAARRHEASGRLSVNRAVVLAAVRAHPGLTAVELVEHCGGLERHEVSRRLADAFNAGQVSHGEKRVCRVKGTKQMTWEPA